MSSNSWLEMTSHLQRSWLGEDPILVQRLKETDGSLEETEQVLSTYAAENAGCPGTDGIRRRKPLGGSFAPGQWSGVVLAGAVRPSYQ